MLFIGRQILKAGLCTEKAPEPNDAWRADGERIRAQILRLLGRALSIRQVDAGSCNGCELEIHALNNPYYNLEGRGIRFVASPRHADMLLVTGPVAANMKIAVQRAYEAPLAEGLLLERRLFHSLFATADQKEGMAAFVEKRPPRFEHR